MWEVDVVVVPSPELANDVPPLDFTVLLVRTVLDPDAVALAVPDPDDVALVVLDPDDVALVDVEDETKEDPVV